MTRKQINFDKIKVGDKILVEVIVTELRKDPEVCYFLNQAEKKSIRKHIAQKTGADDLIKEWLIQLNSHNFDKEVTASGFKAKLLEIAKVIKSENKKTVKTSKKKTAQLGSAKRGEVRQLASEYSSFLKSYEAIAGVEDPEYLRGYVKHNILKEMFETDTLYRLSAHLKDCVLHVENNHLLIPAIDLKSFDF
jgi:hypothetical protein